VREPNGQEVLAYSVARPRLTDPNFHSRLKRFEGAVLVLVLIQTSGRGRDRLNFARRVAQHVGLLAEASIASTTWCLRPTRSSGCWRSTAFTWRREYHEGHRANFSSVDLTGRDFSGLNLRGIKMDRALLSGADFTGAHLQSANLIGAIAERACFDRVDLSRARLSGANLVSASLKDACLARADMEFALMANTVLRGACLREADMSGAQLDAVTLTGADLRKANLRGAGFRHAKLDVTDLRDARLGGALLVGASLAGADLRRAYLRLAKLDGADLSDANLEGVEGLTQGQLNRARFNSGTRLPAGLTGVEDGKR
jgi:uncharacterized protein YjbI with pentapeptide repeats